ncbi:TonB-dependent siderophore receptor [Arcobacter sp. YIC-464]|uniref:TonB-dependent siderophore receptor n=1 Tax=Arcobacter sp. YIC-464 TaxID=3376631 RepID=UPI003C1AFD6A
MNFRNKKLIGISFLTAALLQSSIYADEKKDEKSLGSVDIVSTNVDEDKGSYAIESMSTSTGLDLSIKQTPQSITVLTVDELEDRNIFSYQSLLKKVNGVSIERWDERVNALARGFEVDYYQFDGIPTYSSITNRDPDLALYDRVEIVKGANGLMTGAGNPAISMNFVRKRADSKVTNGTIDLSAGSWDNYSATADISTPLTKDGKIRSRFIVKHEDGDYFLDDYERKNDLFYGVIDADLTDTTTASIGFSYQKLDRTGIRWGGLPAFYDDGTRTDFSSSKNPTDDWTYRDLTTKSYYFNLEQRLKNDMKVNFSYSRLEAIDDTSLLYLAGKVNKTDGSGLGYYTWTAKEQYEEDTFDLNASIPFAFANLEHELVLGYSHSTFDVTDYPYFQTNGTLGSLNNINVPRPTGTYNEYKKGKTTQDGLYASSKISLSNDLKLILGARLSNWEYNGTKADGSSQSYEYKNELTPFAGVVYDLNDTHSIYASYTSIFNSQDKRDPNGNYIDAVEGNSYETGVKGEYFNGALNASVSVFRIEQENVAEEIDGVKVGTSNEQAYRTADGVVSKGIELSLVGDVSENLSLSAGITNFEAKDADNKNVVTKASRTNANLFALYKINKFNIGAGLNYRSKFYKDTNDGRITQGGYTTAEFMSSYNVNKDLKLQLNIDNLFNKEYYDGIGSNTMLKAEPRKVTASLKYKF